MDWRDRPRCDEVPAWALLRAHAERFQAGADSRRGFDLRQAFAEDAGRAAAFGIEAPQVFGDLSKNLIDRDGQRLLIDLATQCGLAAHRDALLAGEAVNTTEQRAAWHTFLRDVGAGSSSDAIDVKAELQSEVAATLDRMLDFADALRADAQITDVVHIGIGGSDLGPRLAVQALTAGAPACGGPRVRFVANGDGHELLALLPRLTPERTVFLIASKTFGTAETMLNAASARAWFQAQGATDIARHFIGLTANAQAAHDFGIQTVFDFWDWVGGRYSLWSPIGLPVAIAIGAAGFRELLAGAHAMDTHFRAAPLADNLPVRLGLLDVWYRNFLGAASRNVAPYHHGLRRLPAHLQQLEMESNGKSVDARGRRVPFSTAPVIWGDAGSNGQHAFFQMLHQGTDLVPVEFVLVRKVAHELPHQHAKSLANALAQARALMMGHDDALPHKRFAGNRPSTTLLLPDLSPRSLGALLALYEHRVFVSGSLWGVNSFDQWGVELGKRHAGDVELRLADGRADGIDASTAGLIARLRGGR